MDDKTGNPFGCLFFVVRAHQIPVFYVCAQALSNVTLLIVGFTSQYPSICAILFINFNYPHMNGVLVAI
jgi:hypothetical protein